MTRYDYHHQQPATISAAKNDTTMQKSTHIHGQQALEQHIIQLHHDGWGIGIIASMAHCKPDVVQQVLKDKGILM